MQFCRLQCPLLLFARLSFHTVIFIIIMIIWMCYYGCSNMYNVHAHTISSRQKGMFWIYNMYIMYILVRMRILSLCCWCGYCVAPERKRHWQRRRRRRLRTWRQRPKFILFDKRMNLVLCAMCSQPTIITDQYFPSRFQDSIYIYIYAYSKPFWSFVVVWLHKSHSATVLICPCARSINVYMVHIWTIWHWRNGNSTDIYTYV